jgi:hypothetical protein
MRLDVPQETDEQQAIFTWAAYNGVRFPELEFLYHVPNGGKRTKATAGRLKAEGVKSGVPDINLDVPRRGFHGLRIELKRVKGGKQEETQKRWIAGLTVNGYCARFCKGWKEAVDLITWYLTPDKGE